MSVLPGDQAPPGPDWLVREVRELRRELEELRSARASSATSFQGGVFRLLDDSGDLRFAAGHVTKTGGIDSLGDLAAYGTVLLSDDGAVVLLVQEGFRGISYPANLVPFHRPAPEVVTSATFVTVFEAAVLFPAHEVLYLEGSVQTDVGTTGELRVTEGFTGQDTDALTLPSGTNGGYLFRWTHPGPSGLYDQGAHDTPNVFFGLQARRTGGAGSVFVYPPRVAELTSKFIHPTAADNGNPQLG